MLDAEFRLSDGTTFAHAPLPRIPGYEHAQLDVNGEPDGWKAVGSAVDFPLLARVGLWDDTEFEKGELPGLADELDRFAALLDGADLDFVAALAALCRAGASWPPCVRVVFVGD